MAEVGGWLGVAVVVVAPLLVGGVHRIPLMALMGTAAIAIGLLNWGTAWSGRPLRVGSSVLAPLCFLLIPVLQSVPIPLSARRVVDPKGTALLTGGATEPIATFPLSLDPPNTRADIGKSAAALAIFIIAYHLASGQRRRQIMLRAIGVAGICAVVIGLGHRMMAVSKIYGVIATSAHRTLLIGPFVNANHSCEFLELSAFVCLACSFQRPTALNRIGWMAGMTLCLGGAAATLSRGGLLAVAVAVLIFVFQRYFAKDEDSPNRRRVSLAWGGLLLGLVALSAGALGASQLVDRFHSGTITSDVRFQLWRDSLKVLAAHPFGIGRGAFDHVFPIYRTLRTAYPLRFAFVENEPLQFLIEAGWPFFVICGVAVGLIVYQIARQGRHDKIEAALVAGLFAIVVHNLVDFGLETLGVLLPFMAILGTTLGRAQPASFQTLRARGRHIVIGVTCACLVVGLVSIAQGSYDNFDVLLKNSRSMEERRQLLIRAQRAHPTDYYYALLLARLEPLRARVGGPSPRFHALNRALVLCPSCDAVHVDVARNLWALGLRRQALLEWRAAIALQPNLLTSALGELSAAGGSPQELASAASTDPARLIEVAAFLASISRNDEALTVLGQAEALGASRREILLMRARLQLQTSQMAMAEATLSQAHTAGIHDVRLTLLEAQVLLAAKGPLGADQALGILDEAAAQYPLDLAVQRARIDLVMTYEKWQAADRALEGLKQALYRSQGTAVEAHVASARVFARLSRWTNALGEYRIALADARFEVSLWMEYGHAAESAGRNATAREAYAEAARLSPTNPDIGKALQTLDDHQAKVRALDLDMPQRDPNVP